MPPLYESMIPQDRRGSVAALVRAAAQCTTRKRFYTYAALHGLLAACDYLDIQRDVDPASALALRHEIEDVIEETQ